MLRLSFSNYKVFKDCSQQYAYIASKEPLPEEDNKVNALFGSIIGTVFEEFYLWSLWKNPDPVASALYLVDSLTHKIAASYVRPGRSKLDFADPKANYSSLEDVSKDVRKFTVISVATILENGLYGEGSKAEVVLDASNKDQGVFMVGRADFIIPTEKHGLLIVDGKGSKHHDKYLDVDQLYWYAVQHQILTGKLPDRLAFLNWRYKGEKAISWHEVTEEALSSFRSRLGKVVERVASGKIQPEPGNGCRFCPYLSLCKPGSDYQNLGLYDFGEPSCQP